MSGATELETLLALVDLFHVKDKPAPRLGQVDWPRVLSSSRAELSALVACMEALERCVDVLSSASPSRLSVINTLAQARTALTDSAK